MAMHAAKDEPQRATAIAFAHHVAGLWEDHLDHRLVGIYLLGSLAHGGFSARYSDIDMALIADDPLGRSELDLIQCHRQVRVLDMLGQAEELLPQLSGLLVLPP